MALMTAQSDRTGGPGRGDEVGGTVVSARRELRTPRAAGAAGLVFAILLVVALLVMRDAIGQPFALHIVADAVEGITQADLLAGPDDQLAKASTAVLIRLGDLAVPQLLEAATDADEPLRRRAHTVLRGGKSIARLAVRTDPDPTD